MFKGVKMDKICMAAIANVATALGSIPSSSDTVESEGRQVNLCCINLFSILKSTRDQEGKNKLTDT